jgi:D-aminopeptidase
MTSTERKLLAYFRPLSDAQQQTLLAFAEFLSGQKPAAQTTAVSPQPVSIARPEQESVIKAIKRLNATYPMLERNKLLHETSNQMTRHVIHGVPAVQVIDELEVMFRRHYEVLISPPDKLD